eukprot:31339-Pelagococcus_subviridis.AAC.4
METTTRHAGSAGTPTRSASFSGGGVDGGAGPGASPGRSRPLPAGGRADAVTREGSSFAASGPSSFGFFAPSAGFASSSGARFTASRRGVQSFSRHASQYSYRPNVSSASPRGTQYCVPSPHASGALFATLLSFVKNESQLSGASPSPVEDTTYTRTFPGDKTSFTSTSFIALHVVLNPFAVASAAVALQISVALPVCEPYRNRTIVASPLASASASASPPPGPSRFRRAMASPSAGHSVSHHGSTASSNPTASFASPRCAILVAPNECNAESSVCAAWLQSFAVVVCLSKSKFVSPSPSTAYDSVPRSSVDSPDFRLRL